MATRKVAIKISYDADLGKFVSANSKVQKELNKLEESQSAIGETIQTIRNETNKTNAVTRERAKSVKEVTLLEEKLKNLNTDQAKKTAFLKEQIRKATEANTQYAKSLLETKTNSEKGAAGINSMNTSLNGSKDQFRRATGLSGAFATEIGRTAQDASYGFNAIGNNLSQMSTLFGAMVSDVKSKGGSMADVFRQISATLTGTTGIIVLINVLIGLIQSGAFESFFEIIRSGNRTLGGMAKSIESVVSNYSDLNAEFEANLAISQNTNRTREEQIESVKKLRDEFGLTEEQITDLGDSFKVNEKAVKDFREELVELALSAAALDKLKKNSEEALEDVLGSYEDFIEKRNQLDKADIGNSRFASLSEGETEFLNKNIKLLKDKNITEEKRLEVLENIDAFEKAILDRGKKAYDDLAGNSSNPERIFGRLSTNQKPFEEYIDKVRDLADANKDLNDETKDQEEKYKNQNEALKELIKTTEKSTTTSKTPKKDFKAGTLKRKDISLADDIVRETSKSVDSTKKTFEEESLLELETSNKLIEIKKEEFIQREELRFKNFKAEQELRLKIYKNRKGISKTQKKQAEIDTEEAIRNAKVESDNAIVVAVDESNQLKEIYKVQHEVRLSQFEEQEEIKYRNHQIEADRIERETSLLERKNQVVQQGIAIDQGKQDTDRLFSEAGEVFTGEGDSEALQAGQDLLDLAVYSAKEEAERELQAKELENKQAHVQALIDEQKKLLDNDNLVGAEREAIVNRRNELVKQSGELAIKMDALEALSKKETLGKISSVLKIGAGLAKKGSKTQKALAITAATIDMFASAQSAYKSTIGTPFVGPVLAPIAAAGAIAVGLKNIKNIKNSGKGGGGGSESSAPPPTPTPAPVVKAPDFNIIGSTGTNQIANTIADTNKKEQPIKAYVVSQEVSGQQELDRNIKQNAEF